MAAMNLDTAIRHDIAARARLPEHPRPSVSVSDYLLHLAARLDAWRLDNLTRHAEALVQEQECRA